MSPQRGDVVLAKVAGEELYLVVLEIEPDVPVRLVCKGKARYQLRPSQLRPTTRTVPEEKVRELEGR
jgi:hypothetical protein